MASGWWPRTLAEVRSRCSGNARAEKPSTADHDGRACHHTDPVPQHEYSDRSGLVRACKPPFLCGATRVTAPGIALDRLPPIDCILLSHNHYDHLDLRTMAKLHGAHRPVIVTSLGNDTIIRSHVPDARTAAGDWHDSIDLGRGVSATITPANHWSARGTRDRRMALWSGFILKHQDTSLYFAGDTGYGGGTIFGDIRARYGAQRFALLPIGAYEPRDFMASQHCNPSEAVRIMSIVGAQSALGMHWGTFQLTNEAREAPKLALHEALAERGITGGRFQAADVGGTYDLEDL